MPGELDHLEGTNDTPPVVGLDDLCRNRIRLLESREQDPWAHLCELILEPGTHHRVGRGDLEMVERCTDIQSRAAHQDRPAPARSDIGEVQPGFPLVCRHVGLVAQVKHVKLMVGDATAFLERELGGADVHAAIQLHRIGIDDLAVESLGQVQSQIRLATCGWPHDRDDGHARNDWHARKSFRRDDFQAPAVWFATGAPGHHVEVTPDAWSSAEPYELFMGRWSRLLATEVVAWVDPRPGLRWLDVGCGTGALSGAVLAGAAPVSLVGVDPSAAYLAAAAARLEDWRVTFSVGGATALPLPDSSVDHVVCGLVLNFVPDPVTALREMRRVLVAAGRATAYVWDYPDGMQMLRHFWAAAATEDPAAAALDEGTRFPICRVGGLERFFAEGGFDELEARPVEVPTVFRDFDDYWAPFLGGQGSAPGYCVALSQESRDRLRARLEATLPSEPDGTIRLTARAWAVTGVSS